MRYYRKVDEGIHAWGDPTYLLEIDEHGDAVRELAIYPNGCVLRYSPAHKEDEHGALAVMVVDKGNAGWWAQYEITRADFERAWQKHSEVVTVPMGQPPAE